MRNAIFALCRALVAFAMWNVYSFAPLRRPCVLRSEISKALNPRFGGRQQKSSRSSGPQAKGAQPALIAALNDPEPNGLVALRRRESVGGDGADPDVAIQALVEPWRPTAAIHGLGWALSDSYAGRDGGSAQRRPRTNSNMRETPTHALASLAPRACCDSKDCWPTKIRQSARLR